jgi:ubiquinone/menaquinone biosynthesis C-methylase UbiE
MSDFVHIVHENKSTPMSDLTNKQTKSQHAGLRLRAPARYDLVVWLLTLGRPRRFRERMLRPAELQAGERVLDVSCGTGSLALLAKEQVGAEGQVHGVDASEEMIAYARRKASRAGLDVAFDAAPAQQIPFGDASFDVVLNTLALHHLPRPSRYEAFEEMRRVLKPSGRALIVDFAEGKKRASGLLGRITHRHGSVPPKEIAEAMRSAGFEISTTGPIGAKNLHFVVGRSSDGVDRGIASSAEEEQPALTGPKSHMAPVAAVLVAGLLAIHAAGGATILHGTKGVSGGPWAVIGAVVLAAIAAKAVWLLRRLHRR